MPDINNKREHVLYFAYSHYFSGIEPLLAIGKKAGVTRPKNIISEVMESIVNWKGEFRLFGVPADEINRLSPEIDRRLKKV